MKKYILILVLLFLVGCETKHHEFEPKEIDANLQYQNSKSYEIINSNRYAATLKNLNIITKTSELEIKIPKNYILLNSFNDEKFIIADKSGNLQVLTNENVTYENKFQDPVVSANIQGNLLALLTADNQLYLIDTRTNSVLLEEKSDNVYALDSRIAAPYFLGSLIMYPTLDGKIIIVEKSTQKVLRTIVISAEPFFNNVIYFDVYENRLVAATQKRVLAISPAKNDFYDENIKDIKLVKDGVVILSEDGSVILTDEYLNILKKKNFKFASYVNLFIKDERLYAIEKMGYIISLDNNLEATKILKLDDEVETNIFISDNAIYYNNKKINFKDIP